MENSSSFGVKYILTEYKKDIIKLLLSAVLLIAAAVVSRLFTLPVFLTVILFLVPYLIAGFSVFKEAAENLIKGKIFDENFLMCIASVGAFFVKEYPEAVFVMLFFGIGELFEEISSDKSRRTVKALLDIRPDTATVIKDTNQYTVLAKDIPVGSTVKVLAGERIPLDGVIVSGVTSTDNSAVTGESLPQSCTEGDCVFGGCVNLSGVIEVKVTKSFTESTASKILSLVENAAEKKSKSEKLIRKFAKIYTPAVCIAALLLAVVPSLIFGHAETYIYRALTFLVVSCPCALIVSVPLTYFSGIACAAKRGVLIKGAQYLERISKIKTVLFDKTGTLTKAAFSVVSVNPHGISKDELLLLAAGAEANSLHPIALSIKAAADGKPLSADSTEEIAGEGIICNINGDKVAVGNRKLMERLSVEFAPENAEHTAVYVSKNGEFAGSILIGDKVREDAAEAVSFFRKRGIKTVMLTGDKEAPAKAAAGELALDGCHFELSPEGKVKTLEEYLKLGDTAFIGDGINDAPVIREADIGISMGALGSDAALEASDAVILGHGIKPLCDAFTVSKKTRKIATENIIFSLAVKLIILILCGIGIGVTDMWIAAFGDVGVLIIAVLNSLRAIKFT